MAGGEIENLNCCHSIGAQCASWEGKELNLRHLNLDHEGRIQDRQRKSVDTLTEAWAGGRWEKAGAPAALRRVGKGRSNPGE